MQGDSALPSLLEGISTLERDAAVDVIVVTRGGGADKHLRVFNELPLCRVLSRTDTPLVAAIGHENDQVLAGAVADERVMTPTGVGSTVIPQAKADLREKQLTAASRLDKAYLRHIEDTVAAVRDDLNTAYTHTVTDRLATVSSDLNMAFETHSSTKLTARRNQLDHSFESFKQQLEHESEKEDAVAEAKAEAKDELEDEVRAKVADKQRRQLIIILVLLLLVLLLGAYLITQM